MKQFTIKIAPETFRQIEIVQVAFNMDTKDDAVKYLCSFVYERNGENIISNYKLQLNEKIKELKDEQERIDRKINGDGK